MNPTTKLNFHCFIFISLCFYKIKAVHNICVTALKRKKTLVLHHNILHHFWKCWQGQATKRILSVWQIYEENCSACQSLQTQPRSITLFELRCNIQKLFIMFPPLRSGCCLIARIFLCDVQKWNAECCKKSRRVSLTAGNTLIHLLQFFWYLYLSITIFYIHTQHMIISLQLNIYYFEYFHFK